MVSATPHKPDKQRKKTPLQTAEEASLEVGIEDSFPASDPPSATQPQGSTTTLGDPGWTSKGKKGGTRKVAGKH